MESSQVVIVPICAVRARTARVVLRVEELTTPIVQRQLRASATPTVFLTEIAVTIMNGLVSVRI